MAEVERIRGRVQPGEDPGQCPTAVAVQDLVRKEGDVRRDTGDRTRGADDAGHVGAVEVVVVGVGVAMDVVVTAHDAAATAEAAAEVGMVVVDPGVEHRDGLTGPGDRPTGRIAQVPDRGRAHVRDRVGERCVVLPVGIHPRHPGHGA